VEARIDLPVVCSLNSIDAADRPRHAALLAELLAAIVTVTELPEGVLLTLPSDPETCRNTMEWATLERRCCPFLTLGMELLPDGGPLRLSLRGPAGTRELLVEMLATGSLPASAVRHPAA
jgi:hypothetical protein